MDLGMEPSQWAELLAGGAVAAMQARLQTQQGQVKSEQTALTALKKTLTDFRAVMKGFNTSNSGMIKNSATANQEGFVSLKASASASKGLYQFEVKQTAAAEQKSFEQMTDDDIKNASGTMSIKVGEQSIDIDMDTVGSLAELRDAINKDGNNPGVTASLMKINGKTELMLASDKTGMENQFTLSADNADFDQKLQQGTTISAARDAEIVIGGSDDGSVAGRVVKSSTNTFKDLIPGVEINVIQKTEAGRPLVINVENDESGTKEQLQKFVDAYNTMRSSLDELTKSGGDKESRGALAGDSGIRVLEEQMNALVRDSFGGKTLDDFGIETDKEGKLSIDNDKLEEGLRDNPAALNGLFSGDGGMMKAMEKGMDKFLNVSNGSIKSRQDSLDRKTQQMTVKTSQIELRYNSAYDRYLKQFTRAQTAMASMERTMAQFSS